MEYKGYNAVVTYDNDMGILHGEVIDTRDIITFQARSVDELHDAFKSSVDGYLKFCEEKGREPEKPFSGRIALRLDPETHRAIVGAARTSGKSLNTWIADAIGRELHPEVFDDAVPEVLRETRQLHVDRASYLYGHRDISLVPAPRGMFA